MCKLNISLLISVKGYIIFRTSTVLHLYDDENIDRLNVLLGKQNSHKILAPVGKQNGSSEAVWIVHVPFADEAYLSNIFRRTPLRLDSHVYAFYRVDNSGSFKH